MKNVYIYCEGQTEESFINEVLAPYFAGNGIWVSPIVCTTKRTQTEKQRGGVSNYYKIKTELTILCKQHKNELVTTMFDYYGMPDNTPFIDCTEKDIFKRMDCIEQVITRDIGQPNCFFGLTLHEFEGLLFSEPSAFQLIADSDIVEKIQKMREEALSPEHINNSQETAPSKRLKSLIPDYAKIRYGTILSKEIGIDCMLRECHHFSDWIKRIKDSSKNGIVF